MKGAPLKYLGRALLLRCPNCGERGIFESWFRQKDRCPRCGLPFTRGEQGYIVGAYMFNIIVAELVFAALFIGVLLVTWPAPPWTLLTYGARRAHDHSAAGVLSVFPHALPGF